MEKILHYILIFPFRNELHGIHPQLGALIIWMERIHRQYVITRILLAIIKIDIFIFLHGLEHHFHGEVLLKDVSVQIVTELIHLIQEVRDPLNDFVLNK